MNACLPLVAIAALSLTGCTHLGTNISGDFACRAQTGRDQTAACQPLSEVDARALRELVKTEGAAATESRSRLPVAVADKARTGERTLKVVFPAHVDAAGTLHEEAVAWTVVEAARWAGELRRNEIAEPKGTMRALRQALKDQAQRAEATAHQGDTPREDQTAANPGILPPEDSAPAAANPFIASSPLVLPSPGGEAQVDAPASVRGVSAAGGSDMSPTPHDRAPRPLEEAKRVWPSAEAIEAAKSKSAKEPR